MPSPALPNHRAVDPDVRANWDGLKVRSRLAAARRQRGISQEYLAPAVGISLASYRRLEALEIDNPPLLWLVNLALALEVELVDILEDDWITWTRLKPSVPGETPRLRQAQRQVKQPAWPPAQQDARTDGA